MLRTRFGIAAIAAALFLSFAGQAFAISQDEFLASFGSGAGQLERPDSVAADPHNRHVFVVEVGNCRIIEFAPWGDCVKGFGWNVAPGPVNEQQEITARAIAGEFELTLGASTTAGLARNASAEEVASISYLRSLSEAGA